MGSTAGPVSPLLLAFVRILAISNNEQQECGTTLLAHRGGPESPEMDQIVGCGVGCSGQLAEINKLGEQGGEAVTLNASNRILLKRAE
jgi:hypothetical protein